MSSNLPIFFEYDTEAEEQKLVKMFEEQTGKPLYPAQDERLLISLIEYKASLLVNKFNEAARLNLTRYSRGSILDCIGEMFGTARLKGSKGKDFIKITLNTTFTSDLTIAKGLEILSKDEEYSFFTTENCVIPAGETVGTVEIEAETIGEYANVYGIGDVNILVKPISYIQSVENINGVSGGADVEDDAPYIKRILLAPESFSCAGSRQSYIYHTLSANANIIDAQAESPVIPATIKIGDDIYTEENGRINTGDFTASVDYKAGSITFTKDDVTYCFKIPPQATVYVYPLTDDDVTPETVLQDVRDLLTGESVNPMTDYVNVIAPEKVNTSITMNVLVKADADFNSVCDAVDEAAEKYKKEIRKTLKASIEPSHIYTKIGAIDGVYSVDLNGLTTQTAGINEFFDITFTINTSLKSN